MKKNYIYNLLLSITNILFPILSFPYASRVLGPIGIGKVQLTITFAQYFGLFAAFGIPIYGIQEIAKHRKEKSKLSKTFSELIIINAVTSLLVTFIYLLTVSSFTIFKNNYTLYLYSGIIVIFSFASLDWLYSGLEEFRIITLRSVFIKIISLLLLYIFIKGPKDYLVYLFITIFSVLGNNLISLYFIRNRTKFSFKNIELAKYVTPLFFIFASTIAASMYTYLDTILLGFLSNEKAVGLYTAALKVTKIAIPFITAAGAVMVPKFSIAFKENDKTELQKLLDNSWHYIIFFSIPIFNGLLIFANDFILLLSGVQFINAVITMQILSLLPFIIGLGYFFGFQLLIPMGKNKEMFISVLIGMIISLILNFILVPILNEKGTAIVSVITEIVVTSMYIYFVKKHFDFSYNWKLIFKSLASCILFLPFEYFFRNLNLITPTRLFLGVSLSGISYFLIQIFIFKDLYVTQYLTSIKKKIIK